jgi:three-Cys-motif partner protein
MDDAFESEGLWPIGPHTPGKHIVLKAYLDAWFPILGSTQGRILFIDGFAGPGRYSGGEDGSPIIALKALRDHPFRLRLRAEIVFMFIEREQDRADHLRREIVPFVAELGTGVRTEVITGEFDETMTSVLQQVDEQKRSLAPAFVMVDPFGISHTPLSVIGKILENSKSEVYISFMWEFFNRFKAGDEFPPHLDGLFGCTEWREAIAIPDWRRRRDFIFELYKRQLKAAGAEYVVHFELFNQATLVYAIFFATKHAVGCDKMKAAIWKADPFNGFAFVGGRDPTAGELFGRDIGPLKAEIQRTFAGEEWRTIEELRDWIMTDATDYHSGQLKAALRELEQEGHVVADSTTRKRARQYPDGCRIQITRS